VDAEALAQTAAQRFVAGDEAAFVACFDPDVSVYWEPALATTPIIGSRAALEGWLDRTREPRAQLTVTTTEPARHGDGLVLEVVVVQEEAPEEVWRLALAVCLENDLIREVRAFWAHDAAVAWLVGLR
jgi:hypothetical protein